MVDTRYAKTDNSGLPSVRYIEYLIQYMKHNPDRYALVLSIMQACICHEPRDSSS